MVMRASGPPPGPRSSESQAGGTIAVLGALAAFAGLFTLAYRWGSSTQASEGSSRAGDAKRRSDFLRDQVRQCTKKTTHSQYRTANLKGEAATLWQTNKQLEEDNERLVKMNEELEKRSIECVEGSELQKQTWSDEDKKNADALNKLDKHNKELRLRSKRLSSVTGMRMVLLQSGVQKLGEENRRLRAKLGMESVAQDEAYANSLVAKWKDPQAGAAQISNLNWRNVVAPNRTEFTQILRKPKTDFQFDEDRHSRRIFFPTKTNDGDYTKPSWNGRSGTQKLQHGVHVGERYVTPVDISRSIRILYEYALCAMGNNITRFMYPNHFRATRNTAEDSLVDYIETPLVLFCDDCMPQHRTGEFKLLCQGYSSEDQYGSFMFWRMRSRIVFKSTLRMAAERWMEHNDFTDRTSSLAVRLVRATSSSKCNRRPQLSYLRLLKGRAHETSDSVEEQCNPSIAHVLKVIKSIARKNGVSKVFFSLEGVSEDEWSDLQTGVQEAGAQAFRRLPGGQRARDAALDILIASQMGRIIVNRWDITSTHIAEYFLLENRLRSQNITVW
eukprot:TRINITY_DN876_c0_g1_i1.p1 TRINITY_DN876_c0_g1~~TRINITY_DN876_c0_g1_i1.p1  ORF type:complete len:557 (+),score=169.91 TRINITY_DN876_c0_g1_i1:102-1772(+)